MVSNMRVEIPVNPHNSQISLEIPGNSWDTITEAILTVSNFETGEVAIVKVDLVSLYYLIQTASIVRNNLSRKETHT